MAASSYDRAWECGRVVELKTNERKRRPDACRYMWSTTGQSPANQCRPKSPDRSAREVEIEVPRLPTVIYYLVVL